jgi:hypothetical protein
VGTPLPRSVLPPNEQFQFFVLPVTVEAASTPTRDLVPIAAGRCAVKKRVLVTGGAGLLGSHLCALLLN